ncbi:MAG: MlaE family ABC transporter permease [Candidatus Adiutrix sp.]
MMGGFNCQIEATKGANKIILTGDLTSATPQSAWPCLSGPKSVLPPSGKNIIFNLSALTALDLNGAAQLLTAINAVRQSGVSVSTESLPAHFVTIFDLASQALKSSTASPSPKLSFFADFGRSVLAVKDDFYALSSFTGELLVELWRTVTGRNKVPWAHVFNIAETAGVNALPIVSLVSGLVGLIIAFQAAMLMKLFGAEIFVADLVGFSIIRELGPLIAGIMLAGRSGSAFSAELGAMKVAEEVDAIVTMGLSPVRELALPRVLASCATTPLVTIIASFIGIAGGSIVLLAMGYPLSLYWEQALSRVTMSTYLIGLGKSFIFGFTLAAVGCQRGLAAGDGPGAVGQATTSGVVANIVLIAILDSLFAVMFYVLGI